MVDQIIKGKRIGLLNINLGPFGQQTASYLNRVLKPYISDGIKVDDETIYDWELISDDTLLESNILLFKNRKHYYFRIIICVVKHILKSILKMTP